ncbi:Oidioi.mRNA.OKI2018_I69.YSR.g17131.t1.cds [Oikopleura dioica]|uniref:Oidioi.mRNA.OKI2018_I69.YSR.g17131.t1.cds n=1 Tax=Oikopleura dioica TaxID=34765 RepID=A0ABN7SNF5_OIKDI|nr:Oidioi.mRNA.OKI2018_I69.YSR.g17131.t1.cds [Oikopleura dioica]
MQIVPFDGAIMVPYQNETSNSLDYAQHATQVSNTEVTPIGPSNRNTTENNLREHDQSAAQTQQAYGTSIEPRHSNDESQENIEGLQAVQNESEYQTLVPIENEPTFLNNFNPRDSLLRQSCSVDENAQLRNRNDFDKMFNPPCRKGSVTDDENHYQTTATKRTKFSPPTDNGCLTTSPTDNFD